MSVFAGKIRIVRSSTPIRGITVADGFATDKDGKVRPINGKSGKGGAVTAALIGAVLALGSGTGGTSLLGGAGESAARRSVGEWSIGEGSVGDPAIKKRVRESRRSARAGNRQRTWRRMRLDRVSRKVQRRSNCSTRSFGRIRAFFANTPCRSLRRSFLILTDERGNTFALSIAWVRMPTTTDARELRELDDIQGTGDVSHLFGDGQQSGNARFTGKYYESDRRGSLFVRGEAAPVTGNPDPDVLRGAAYLAKELPPAHTR